MQIMNKTEVKHQVYATHLTASNIPIIMYTQYSSLSDTPPRSCTGRAVPDAGS